MKILALESSSQIRSVALCEGVTGGGQAFHILASIESVSERGGRFASLIDEVLSQANVNRSDVEEIAVGVGPGSAAGIRSTLAFARGWEVARGIPLTGVSSVWAVAVQCQTEGIEGDTMVVLRGPLGKFYHAAFQISPSSVVERLPLALDDISNLPDRLSSGCRVVGPDLAPLFAQISHSDDRERYENKTTKISPMAVAVARLALGCVAGAIVPAEPLNLVTPQFVKAPPPREIPGL
ncbi:MAG: tRNA (adenosine(37)-N6)-threonylcarbamoyltransferase complex dimerization subunit type 1 TsaB [Verrucomicrobia bacterium]|jgi:tRNA threonylcarbamoyladenosine biosynthesis protein TsaB|nr:tRNA (adenosine(37)-N6)-threonylcarbamoyltransferase complex dimerization subunit type 1 TsaB [Verrucomicrobiota bacterium]